MNVQLCPKNVNSVFRNSYSPCNLFSFLLTYRHLYYPFLAIVILQIIIERRKHFPSKLLQAKPPGCSEGRGDVSWLEVL